MCGQANNRLRPDQLEPDPQQPRRTFPPETINSLQRDIEANGQLQPILVRKSVGPSQYFIIFGECRWRAITQSSIVSTISAILRRHDTDEATILSIQLAENTKRSDITALELAHSYTRLMALSKPLGKTQKQVAEEQGIAQARFSKYLSLAKAPEEIQKVSSEDGLQDLGLLSDLNKAYNADPTGTLSMLTQWRQSPEKGPLRLILDKFLNSLTAPKTPATTSTTPAPGPTPEEGQQPEKTNEGEDPTTLTPASTGIELLPHGDGPQAVLTIHIGQTSHSFRLSPQDLAHLTGLLKGIQ